MPFHSGYGYGTGDWLWSIFSTAVFVVLVTMAILLLIRLLSGGRRQGPGMVSRPAWPAAGPGPGHGPGPGAQSAERILAERYARGEISEEEYRSRLEVLRQTGFAAGGPGQGGGAGGSAYGESAYTGSAYAGGAYGGAWAQPVPHSRPIPEPQAAPRPPEPQAAPRPQWRTTEPPVAASAPASSAKSSSSDAPDQPTEEVR